MVSMHEIMVTQNTEGVRWGLCGGRETQTQKSKDSASKRFIQTTVISYQQYGRDWLGNVSCMELTILRNNILKRLRV